MEIWLKHPAHGVKCASLEAEALADRSNGWQDCEPYGWTLKQPEVALPVESPYVPDPAPEKRKPGRPRKL